jgi:hypothetical protein
MLAALPMNPRSWLSRKTLWRRGRGIYISRYAAHETCSALDLSLSALHVNQRPLSPIWYTDIKNCEIPLTFIFYFLPSWNDKRGFIARLQEAFLNVTYCKHVFYNFAPFVTVLNVMWCYDRGLCCFCYCRTFMYWNKHSTTIKYSKPPNKLALCFMHAKSMK